MTALELFLRRTELLAPFGATALNGAHNDSVTTLTVDDTTGYPSSGMVRVNREYVLYAGKTGTTFTGCTRGYVDSEASAQLDNTAVFNVRFQYLFIPGEEEDDSLEYNSPVTGMPGNTAEGITGRESINFIIDLANFKAAEAISGWLMPIAKGKFPTLTAPSVHVIPLIHGGQSQQTPDFDATGKMFRNCLHEMVADQGGGSAAGTYDDISLGIPEWGAEDGGGYTYSGRSPEDVTIAGVKYRVFQGRVLRFRTKFSAGYPDQYMYSFDFHVGHDF